MSASIRERALLETVVRLSATGSPADKTTRSKVDQFVLDRDCRSVYDVTPGDETVADSGYSDQESVERTLPVRVCAIVDAGEVEGEDTDPAIDVDESALDDLYVFAVQQLIGDDATLGGLVEDVREKGTATVFRPEGRSVIGLEMQFEYIFSTKRGDPTQKG